MFFQRDQIALEGTDRSPRGQERTVRGEAGRERASLFHPRYVSILIIITHSIARHCLPSCLPVRLCLMISRCAALLHLCDWLAICLSGWNAGTGASTTTPCPSSLPTYSRGSAVCKNCPWGGREGGSGLLSSTFDMCPSSSSSQPPSLTHSLTLPLATACLPACRSACVS